jgi:hypothetical protein
LTLLLSFQLVCCAVSAATAPQRIALVIGNSKYTNLGALENTTNDARSIEKSLREMGYRTKILMDVDEMSMRKGVKNFASESNNASMALVFYAGHGAQINGENFLLPTDMDVPKRESDIQLSALKVDDIVNSLKSKIKVVFLDACRDNPALTKSLAKGRGSFRGGLAAAKSQSYEDTGSLFIAYATDSGNVAQDGEGQKNSPFTTALLKHIKKPISIDDMFSLVTREVRLATKNTQKPYKYASLEGVICLPGKCGGNAKHETSNLQNDLVVSTADQEYNLVASSSDIGLISNFVQKYPSHEKTEELQLRLAQSNWGWSDIWLLYEINQDQKSPVYIRPSSIKAYGDRRYFETKWIFERQKELSTVPSDYSYHIHSYVIDCKEKIGNIYQTTAYNDKNKAIFDTQIGDPRYIKLEVPLAESATNGNALINLVCKTETLNPLVQKNDVSGLNWERVYSINDNIDFYVNDSSINIVDDKKDVFVKFQFRDAKKISMTKFLDDKLYIPPTAGFVNVPIVKSAIIHDRFDCQNGTYAALGQRYFDESDKYVGLENYPLNQNSFIKAEADKFKDLMARVCGEKKVKK